MKRKRGGKRGGRGRGSSIKEDEIRKCEGSSIDEDASRKCEGLSIQEDEISEEFSIDENDRISKLPDELIHHILSFMDMIFAVKTCVCSKKWNYMVTSLPTLKLDYSLQKYGHEYDEFNIELVSKALESRNKYIQRLHINLPYEYERPIHSWIQAALEANVEDICISHTSEKIQIPDGTFSSDSLKKLTLVIPRIPIDLSKSSDLPSLVYLKLDYIPSADGEEINKLVASCPVIEYLDLMLRNPITYHGGIKIRSPTLKHLKIRKHEGRTSLSLYAPKLVSLFFESATNNVYLEDVSSLVNATIATKEDRHHGVSHYGASSLSNATMVAKEDGGDDMSTDLTPQRTSLEVLRNVQCLTISVPLLQDIPGLPEFLEHKDHVPEQFDNLRDLKLLQVDFSWSTSVFMIATFLSMSPNIESLILELARYRDWESASNQDELLMIELETLSVMFTLNKLKMVKVSNFQGSAIEMKLLKILLTKADVLEKFRIHCKPVERLSDASVRGNIFDDLTDLRKKLDLPSVAIFLDVQEARRDFA
ncbi:hypothetical protein C5167_047762 [Papaver somniferum]|uniref:F-box domain-containing protein n=1 Tax=Papaver somniferum TaxID=3469 RepID=A0A4Y7LLJ0_PAPSO|nr:putative F-box/FBD/LRR-repeat protein At5g44960 [Papaver somniferum]RZC84979.1 hypothetical protein C5167_047762 [Papaver somniferum]